MSRMQPDQYPSAGAEERLGRLTPLPGRLVVLDPTRVHEHRHRHERLSLIFSLIVIALLVVVGIWLQDWAVLLGIAAVWLSMALLALQSATVNTLRGAAITPTQFPKLFEIFEEVARQFNAPPTEAFVIRDARAQAHAYGIRAPYAVVFHSALLDALEPDELRFVIGQQLGRIVYGHTRMIVLLGGEEESLPALLAQLTWLRDLFFAWYKRVTMLSADRAGVLACGDLEVAFRTLVKLGTGNNQFHEVRADDLVDQMYRVNEGINVVTAAVIWTTSPVPPQLRRLLELVVWCGLPRQPAAQAESAASPPGPRAEGEAERPEDPAHER
jgi:Zn-dependent protease with chaperone function